MSTEELIASFPNREMSWVTIVLLIIAIFLITPLFVMYRKKKFMVKNMQVLALVFVFTICIFAQNDHSINEKNITNWKNTTYQLYLDSLPKIEEEVTDSNVNEDGSITAIAVATDHSIVTYPRLANKEPSEKDRNYISYVLVSGLKSVGIHDGKENVTIYLKPKN